MVGIPEEYLEKIGFDPAFFVKGEPFVRDKNIITSIGSQFVAFGIAFGEALSLRFDLRWYRKS